MPTRGAINRLVVAPDRYDFDGNQEAEFAQLVADLDDVTIKSPIGSIRELQLSPEGRLQNTGHRLSLLAFTQLCRFVATGLSGLLFDVSGYRMRTQTADIACSLPTAVKIYNTCLDLRFHSYKGLHSKQMIRNRETGVIEGIVGAKYRYLPHRELYDAVKELLASHQPPAVFHGATLVGRRLGMVFRLTSPMFTVRGSRTRAKFFGRDYFANSEKGESGISACTMLIPQSVTQSCLGYQFGDGRLSHSGRQLSRYRLQKLLGVTLCRRGRDR